MRPPAVLPPGLVATEPDKAEITGSQSLMRQPVTVTVLKTDASGPFGAGVPTDGHLYYWAPTPAPAPTVAPPHQPPAPPGRLEQHPVQLGAGGPGLGEPQLAAVRTAAARYLALGGLHPADGAPPPTVTIRASGAVYANGIRHYGRSLTLATRRAQAIAQALADEVGEDVPVVLLPRVDDAPEGSSGEPAVIGISPAI